MIGYPKYKEGDVVTFCIDGVEKTGTIEIVDAYGTFEDCTEVSYDILVNEENVLYKHLRETGIKLKIN